MRGSRGRRRGRRKSKAARSKRSSASSSSSSSSKSKSKRRSTAASKRKKVRSVAKAARAAKRAASTSTSSSTSSSKNKTKRKVRKLKLNKKDLQKQKRENVKKAFNKKNEQKKKTISASQSRKQVRQNTKDKISTRKKIGIGSIGKAIGNLTKGRPARAGTHEGKPKSKLQRQWSNLKKDIAQKSTKEARFQRRADRLKRQFGLDYNDMRDLKLNVNMDTILRQKLKIPGTDIKIGLNDRLRKALPKSIRNFRKDVSLGGKFRSPHKLGVREGYRKPNRGGQNIASSTRDQLQSIRSETPGYKGQPLTGDDLSSHHSLYDFTGGGGVPGSWLDFYNRQYKGQSPKEEAAARNAAQQDELSRRQNEYGIVAGGIPRRPHKPKEFDITLPSIPRRPVPDTTAQKDWLGDFYRDYNIGGKGGALDKEARDYWSNEAKTKGVEATMDVIRGTAKAAGTWGGRSKPRMLEPHIQRPKPKRKGRGKGVRRTKGSPWRDKLHHRDKGGIASLAGRVAARGLTL